MGFLGASGALLGASGTFLGASWAALGRILAPLPSEMGGSRRSRGGVLGQEEPRNAPHAPAGGGDGVARLGLLETFLEGLKDLTDRVDGKFRHALHPW